MRSTQKGSWREISFGPGTPFPVSEIEGIDDLPEVRTFDIDRPQIDGDWSGTDILAPRRIILTLGIQGDSAVDLEAKRRACLLSLGPSRRATEPLFLTDGRLVYAKLRSSKIPSDMTQDWRLGEIHLLFYCPDPRIYTGDLQSATLIAGGARLTGRTYPRGYKTGSGAPNLVNGVGPGWTYPPASQIVSEDQITNTGNVPAPMDIVLTGPLLNPQIEVVGESIFPITVSLSASDVLRITRDYHMTLNGVERRDLIAVGAEWPVLPPGTWTLRLFAQSGTGNCQITTRSATL
jgi:hypothetical protein